MQFLVIERFRDGNPIPVYERFDKEGRLMPDDIQYVSSWVTEDCSTCYQIMEAPTKDSLNPWIEAWSDLVDFEVIPVLSSQEARAKVLGNNKK
ncbi:MAG TPA: DUF3303 family protein [Fimbriimonas sp.]|nr:DUF3303 family protein [Fimbriimonas sp.]